MERCVCHHSPAVYPVVLVVTARWYAMQMDPVRESEVKKKMMLERFQEEVRATEGAVCADVCADVCGCVCGCVWTTR